MRRGMQDGATAGRRLMPVRHGLLRMSINPATSEVRQLQDELRGTREELVEAREFLETVLESSTQCSIIVKDLDRRVIGWNKEAERIYGYDASEITGQSSDILHVPEEILSGAVVEIHRQAYAEGHATGLFRRRRKDGTEFLARLTITRRNDGQGNAIGYLVVSQDVTAEQRHFDEQQFLARVGETLQTSLDYAATVERIARLAVGFLGDGCVIDLLKTSNKLGRLRVVHADPEKAGMAQALEQIVPERNHPIWSVLETKNPQLFPEVSPELLRSIAKDRIIYDCWKPWASSRFCSFRLSRAIDWSEC